MFPTPIYLVNPYAYTISHLKIAISRKTFFFTLHLTKATYNLLLIYKKLNIIRRIIIINKVLCKVYPTYSKNLLPIINFKNYYRLSNPIYINLKALKLINLTTYKSLLILDTSFGIITHKEALSYKTGGTLITILY